jgi:hypothetical protein
MLISMSTTYQPTIVSSTGFKMLTVPSPDLRQATHIGASLYTHYVTFGLIAA